MPSIGAKLDIERDAGLLLAQAADAEDRAEVFEDLQKLAQSPAREFTDLASLRDAGVSRRSALYKNAQYFFQNIQEAFVAGGDVYYRMRYDSPFGQSGLLFVDHTGAPENLWNLVTAEGAALAGAERLAGQIVSSPVFINDAEDTPALAALNTNFPNVTPANLVRTLSCLETHLTPEVRQAVLDRLKGADNRELFGLAERLVAARTQSGMDDEKFVLGLNGFRGLSPADATEAMEWFCSKELSWMDGHERNKNCDRNCGDKIRLIRESFKAEHVELRWKKFENYFGSADYEAHRHMAQQILNSFRSGTDEFLLEAFWKEPSKSADSRERAQKRMEDFLGRMNALCDESILDMISLFIMIESQGDPNAQRGIHVGLMQVGMDKFPAGMSEKRAKDPMTNLRYGMRYFLVTCLDGDKRNPDGIFSLGMSNYNFGHGNTAAYRLGQDTLAEETKNYLRDLIIYERFKRDVRPESVLFQNY